MPQVTAVSPFRIQRLAGASLALAWVLGAAAAVAVAAPQITTDGGAPLPDPFQRALPADGAGAVSSISYKAIVFGRLQSVNHAGTPTKGVPGAAGLHFKIGDDGALLGARVTRPSGNPAFDANVLDMVRKAAPFPPPPPGAEREYDATIKFNPSGRP